MGSEMCIRDRYGTEFTAAQYDKIKKVYSIWVCMNPPESRKNSITRYAIQEDNLVGGAQEPVRNYDLLSVVMICLGRSDHDREADVLKLLDVLLSEETAQSEKRRILQEEFDIPMTEHLEQEVSVMCNLSQGIRQKGRVEGRMEGRFEERLESIRALMETAGISSEQAMDMLKVKEQDRPEVRKALGER